MPTTRIDNSRLHPEIASGYDFVWTFQIARRGVVQNLAGATILAAVVSLDRTTTLVDSTAQSPSAPEANWANGLVTIQFPASATTALDGKDCSAWIEISVSLGSTRTPHHQLVTICTGRIQP